MRRKLTFFMLLLFATCGVWAQTTVSGTVTDSSGEPLIGVNILEKGTATGTVTDFDGNYTVDVSGPDAVLVFSYTGYQPVEWTVGSNSSYDLVLDENATLLDEVVVSALGFKLKKDEQGSTYSAIDAGAVNRSGETTLLNGLGAKASNVRINRSNGDPGAGSTIRIRGANTISGDGSPLIIVDGVPLNNATTYGGGNNITGGREGGISQQSRLNDINPSDIESIQVLKGASAAALWGSRAANGVVVITTKDGASGKPRITYKATLSFDEVQERVPMQTLWGQGRNGSYSATGAESWGDYIPDRAGGEDLFDTASGERFIADDGTVYYPIDEKRSQSTFTDENWDAVFQTGGFLQHDFSISGGGDKGSYFFSAAYLDQKGIIKESDYNRTNLRFNNKLYLTDWLSLSTKSSYTGSNSNRIQQSSNTAGLMLGLLRTAPDFDNRDYVGTYIDEDGATFQRHHRSYRRPLGDRVNPTYNNPLWTVNEQSATSQVNRFVVTPSFDITPVSWLQIKLRGSADVSSDKRVYFFPIGSAGDRSPGIFAEDAINRKELNFDAIGKANFSLTSDIDLTTTLGWNINDRTYARTSGQITGFLVNTDKETTSLNSANESSSFGNFRTFRRSNRGYGVLGFDLYDQVFLNFSGALEASSTVKGSFFYPAVDAAWAFIKPRAGSGALSFGKFRASWGKVGVQPGPHRFETLAEGDFSYSSYSDPLNIALFGGGFRIDDDLGNPDIEPEIKTEWEVGTDLRFFDDRLSLGLTYYQNEINGILLSRDLSPSSGYDTQFGNFGAMENKGFESDITWSAIRKPDLSLDFTGNFSTNENKVLDLQGTESINLGGGSVSSRAVVGYPLGVLFGTGSLTDEDGNFILDENGFPQLTDSPQVLGDPNPDWRAGFGFNFRYKNLGINLLLEHSQGGEFSPRTLWVLRRFGTTTETANRLTLDQDLVNFDGDIVPAGTTVRGNIEDFGAGPVLLDETWYRHGIGGGFGDNQAYNFAVKDATFTKLREVTVSYTLNGQGFKDKTKLGSVMIGATARNLFAWDNIKGIDPETNQIGVGNGFGVEYFTNPQTQSYLFFISINY